jgi:hypothetical protein
LLQAAAAALTRAYRAVGVLVRIAVKRYDVCGKRQPSLLVGAEHIQQRVHVGANHLGLALLCEPCRTARVADALEHSPAGRSSVKDGNLERSGNVHRCIGGGDLQANGTRTRLNGRISAFYAILSGAAARLLRICEVMQMQHLAAALDHLQSGLAT